VAHGNAFAFERGVAVIALGVVLHCFSAIPASSEACPPEPSESRAVARIENAASFVLDDGTRLRLMSLLPPSGRDLAAPGASWPAELAARSAVESLLSDRRIDLAGAGQFRDRYGRRIGHVLLAAPGGRVWLQAALVDGGHARVAPLPQETACLGQLFAREAVARAKRVGLWANPAYTIRPARETRQLEQLNGTFQLVEGWVQDVGTSRNELFLNFGRNWRWDFTAAIDLRRSPEPRDALVARLKLLKGRLVRVRGWIEARNGPFMALAAEDVIEELPEGSASGR
jgi:endonuclease YncB( thermonuclease family)